MAKKGLGRGLGRGLDVFYGDTAPDIGGSNNSDTVDKDSVCELKIIDIEPNIKQPRKYFDDEKIDELAESIKEHGVITPILVTKSQNGFYSIIAGERRWRAAKKAGIKTIPAIIKELNKQEIFEISLIENLQRQDLNAVEEALGYKRLMEEFNLTQEQAALKVSKSRSAVANSLRLLNLDDETLKLLSDGRLTVGHAKVLLGVDKQLCAQLAKLAVEKEMSVRELEKLIKAQTKIKPKKNKKQDLNVKLAFSAIEKSLSERLAANVKITNSNGKGKITIEYYSNDELERITEMLNG